MKLVKIIFVIFIDNELSGNAETIAYLCVEYRVELGGSSMNPLEWLHMLFGDQAVILCI